MRGTTMVTRWERSYTEVQSKEVAVHVFAALYDRYGIDFSKPIVDEFMENAVTAVKKNIFLKFKT